MPKVKAKISAGPATLAKPVKSLPEISFDESDIPELKNWEVGGKYTLVLSVEQTSVEKGSQWSSPAEQKKLRARFKVLSVKAQGSAPKAPAKDMASQLKMGQSYDSRTTDSNN